MNFLLPIISFLIGNAKGFFKEPGVALTQQLVTHVRSLTMIIVTCVGSLVLFCVGLSLLISNIVNQMEKEGSFVYSTGSMVYTGMVVIAAAVLIYSLRRQTWLKALGMEAKPEQTKKSGALESAVALLVMDFVEERQSRRQHSDNDKSA
jgi:hypothetical protein